MTDIHINRIRTEISRSSSFAENGRYGLAAQSFSLVRAMVMDCADPVSLRQGMAAQRVPLRATREAFRATVAGHGGSGHSVLFLTDAAALPHATLGQEVTFSRLLSDVPFGRRVDCIGQQGFQSADILALLTNAPKLGIGADVVVMIGHQDSAQPLLHAQERAAMAALPNDAAAGLQNLVTRYGARFAAHLPARPVVPVDKFRANVDGILRALERRGVRRTIVVTIVSAGECIRHNAALLAAAAAAEVEVLDFDRHARLFGFDVADDGHWTTRLHRLFADTLGAHLGDTNESDIALSGEMAL